MMLRIIAQNDVCVALMVLLCAARMMLGTRWLKDGLYGYVPLQKRFTTPIKRIPLVSFSRA